MHTPTFVASAAGLGTNDEIINQEQAFFDQFQRAVTGPNVHTVSILLQTDSDNVLRRWGDPATGAPPRLPNAMVPHATEFAQYNGSLAYRIPAEPNQPIFSAIPIETFSSDSIFAATRASALIKQQIRGRYVLIGGNIEDIDTFQTPLSKATVEGENVSTWGLDIFAGMLAQELDRKRSPPISGGTLWAMAIVVVAAGMLTIINRRGLIWVPILLVQLIGMIGVPFWLADQGYETYGLPAFGWLTGYFISMTVVGSVQSLLSLKRRRLAENALSKYLPGDIAQQILRDPDWQKLKGERRSIFVLFSDLEGFTALTHTMEPEMVELIINRYLDILSGIVILHGGTLDKFVGDAVVAFWGAPVSRLNDGANAVKAAIAMHYASEQFRFEAPEGAPPIGRTRIGLHWGEVIVGNFGGAGRVQYTALGDTMNTAARLESANKHLGTNVLVSGPAVERCGLDIFRPLGRVVLSGRVSPIEVYEPVPGRSSYERREFAALAEKATFGDVEAIAAVGALAGNAPEDKALANFVFRLKNQQGDSYYVLDVK